MTNSELVERYTSDTRSVHDAFERGIIDAVQHETWLEKLDREFFASIGFAEEVEALCEPQYSVKV